MDEMDKVLEVMKTLRSEGGCNWDRAQNHKSLIPYLLEESYEVVHAIENEDDENLKEELGDLLFQVVFHSRIASEEGRFQFSDVAGNLSEKLIRRHPHVFQNQSDLSPEEVVQNWQKIKENEKKDRKETIDVPIALPALDRAHKIQKKAADVGFDWEDPRDVRAKVAEELEELDEEWTKGGSFERMEEELGDLLFAIVNFSRFLKINPEKALRKANEKFLYRFSQMEKFAKEQNQNFPDLSLEEKEVLWKKKKKQGNS